MAQAKRGKPTKAKPNLSYNKTYTVNYDAVEKDRQEADRIGSGGVPWWKAKEGDNTIRVLPPHKDSDKPYHRVYLHYGIGAFPIVCLGKETCPICKYLETQERGHDLRGVLRIYFNILDRKDSTHKVQVYSAGNTVFKEFIEVFLDDDWGDIVDPIEGTDMIVRRSGVGLNTEYSTRFKRNPSPIASTQDDFDAVLDKILDLSGLSDEMTVDQIEILLEGWIDEHADDDGDDNFNRLKKADKEKARKKKAKSKDKKDKEDKESEEEVEDSEVEEDEEEDEDDEEDDDEDVDDEDDDGDDNDDDPEDEDGDDEDTDDDDDDDDGDDDPEENDDPEDDDDEDTSDPVTDALDDILGDDDDDEAKPEKPAPKKKRTKPRKK